eukprot:CFRG4924T1
MAKEVIICPAELAAQPSQFGFQCTWENPLSVSVSVDNTLSKDAPFVVSRYQNISGCNLEMKVGSSSFRSAYFRFHTIFMRLQSEMAQSTLTNDENASKKSTLTDLQRQKICIRNNQDYYKTLQEIREELADKVESDRGQNLVDNDSLMRVRRMLMIWHLCHVLFVASPIGCAGQFYLRDWAKVNIDVPRVSPNWRNLWDVIARLLVIGDIKRAISELESAMRNADHETVITASALVPHLKDFPLLQENTSVSTMRKWAAWSEKIKTARNRLVGEKGVPEQIFLVLCGNTDAIARASKTWYEYGIGSLMYITPDITVENLSLCISDWMSMKPSSHVATSSMFDDSTVEDESRDEFQEVLIAVFEKNTGNLLDGWVSLFKSNFYTAHFADMLYHVNAYGLGTPLGNGASLREWFLLQYADELVNQMTDDGSLYLVSIACNYYSQCQVYGLSKMSMALQRSPVTSEAMGSRIVGLCRKYGLIDTERYICSVIGAWHMRKRMFGAAVSWYQQGGHTRLARRAAIRFLQSDECEAQDFASQAVLSRMETFREIACEFAIIYRKQDGQIESSASSTVDKLITESKLEMPDLWALRLFFNTLKEYVDYSDLSSLNREDIHLFMRCYEDVRLRHTYGTSMVEISTDKTREGKLRQYFTKRLAGLLVEQK